MSVYLRKIRIGGLSYGMNMKESVMEVIDVFKSGGPVMYALLLCSICTAVIMIERGMFYHRAGKIWESLWITCLICF